MHQAPIFRTPRTFRWGLGLILLGLAFTGWPRTVAGQSIEESLRTLGPENGELYVAPLTGGLAAALNSGFYHTAAVHDVLEFDFGIRLMGSWVPDDSDTFVPVLPGQVEVEGVTFTDPYAPAGGAPLLSATVTGEGTGLVLSPRGEFRDSLISLGYNPAQYDVRLPDGYDVPVVPYAALQGAVGVPFGTEVVLRFIPSFTPSSDVGSVSMIGGALKHSLTQWLSVVPPIDVSVAFGLQHFKVGEYLDANSTQFSLIVSKKLGMLTLYTAGTLENADLQVSYEFQPEVDADVPFELETVEFSQDTPNAQTLKLGGTFAAGPVGLHAEYTIASRNVLSASLVFGTF